MTDLQTVESYIRRNLNNADDTLIIESDTEIEDIINFCLYHEQHSDLIKMILDHAYKTGTAEQFNKLKYSINDIIQLVEKGEKNEYA